MRPARHQDAPRKTFLDWVQTGLAVVGGLFALYTVVNEKIFSRPHVTAAISVPLSARYEPGNRELTFAFGLVLQNDGTASEVIKDARARVAAVTDESPVFQFNKTNFRWREGTAEIPIVQPIGKDMWKSFTCEITSPLTDSLKAALMYADTRRDLEVVLTGSRNDTYTVNFHFDFTAATADYLFDQKSASAKTLEFIGSDLQ